MGLSLIIQVIKNLQYQTKANDQQPT